MYIAIILTDRCNAACLHCSTSCGPYRRTELAADRIQAVMDEAAQLADGRWLHFGLSGGEPFLDLPRLLKLIRHGKSRGAEVSCVTNAAWASAPARALRMLRAVQEAGLDFLAISSSRFHEEFIPRSRVERALRTAREIGLECHVKLVHGAGDLSPGSERERWVRNQPIDHLQRIPLLPTLRNGARLDDSAYNQAEALPQGACPAPLLSVREDGQVYGCCTPGAFIPFFRLGDVHRDSLTSIHERFRLGGTHQFLRERGPAHFVPAIRAAGLGERLRPGYAGVCDLCTQIAGDPALSSVARDCVKRFQRDQLQRILAASKAPDNTQQQTQDQELDFHDTRRTAETQ